VTPIVCERGPHHIGAAPNDVAAQDLWEYCCNCQNFWRINPEEPAFSHCPVCERAISTRYLCDQCSTISLDSPTPAKKREFYLSLEGVPLPACPGCLNAARQPLLEHECDASATLFSTARKSCPFCHEKINVPLSFPASVAEYLSQFTGEKLEVSFDTVTRQLVKASPGEFFLLQAQNGIHHSIVLPSRTHFDSQRDFFRHYKDYYDCDEPAAGEVFVLTPATVQKEGKGWSLKEVGRLRLNAQEPQESGSTAPTLAFNVKPSGEQPSETLRLCPACGAPAKPKHKFCKKCGAAIGSSVTANTANLLNSDQTVQEPTMIAPAYAAPQQEETAAAVEVETDSDEPKSRLWLPLSVLVALAVVVGLIVFATNKTSGPTTESKLDEAIARNNLMSPPGESAYDYYLKLKQESASPATLTKYDEKLVPLITARPRQMMDDLINNFESPERPLSEWQEAQRMLTWATELRPADKTIAAKAEFCKGRVAYLQKQWDDALEAWTTASKLDPTLALSFNGMGLIYNVRKEYPTARTYLSEAIRLAPQWAVPYNSMGTAYREERNYYEAEKYYEQAVSRAPNWARPYAWLGDIAKERGDYCRASELYHNAISHAVPGMMFWDEQKMEHAAEDAASKCSSTETE
jgi:predicted nucleic acid-binding Zn ribbon protein